MNAFGQTLKKTLHLFLLIIVVFCNSCKKDKLVTSTGTADGYVSLKDFYHKNEVQAQTFTINASAGGSFTTAKGTQVTIPQSCFVDKNGTLVTGAVTIEFKDIYQKSDMLLSDMPTMLRGGAPLKSGGEFFIRVKSGGDVVQISPNSSNPITVKQPLNGWPLDSGMQAFVLSPADTLGWGQDSSFVSQDTSASAYVFYLYTFNSPLDSGTWCNSDNPGYFATFPQGQLTLHASNTPTTSFPDVFLLFKNQNSMVHVYSGIGNDFPYWYAPLGLQCTMVAVGVGSNGKLYSSFVPITINSVNQSVSFSLSETTTADFKTELSTLNH